MGGDNAGTLLAQSIGAPRHISYEGEMQEIRWGKSRAEATVFRIEHRAPDLTRRLYLAPQSLYGDSIISRGITSYNLDVKQKRVIVSRNAASSDQVALNDNFGLLRANYRTLMGPDETIAGRRVLSVSLISRYTGEVALRLWIDAGTKLVLKKEAYGANGSISWQTRFEHIRYTANLPAALFGTATPPGFSVVRGPDYGGSSTDLEALLRATGFPAVGPKYLPEGFSIVTGSVNEVKNVRTLHLLYSDGIRSLSLFENARAAAVDMRRYRTHEVRFEDHSGRYAEDGPTAILTWEEKGLQFTLVGELVQRELIKIARSVVP